MSRANVMECFQRLKGIGAGGQARVWKAKCVEDVPGVVNRGDVVALKIKDVQDSESDAQFEKLEGRIAELKTLVHPNVVRYLGCFQGRIDGQACHVIVQEYLDGETLKERLSKRRLGLDVDEGLRIVRAAADGLMYTAERKIFHRDVKPGNIFLCEDGTVKLIDFGVAKQEGETVDGASNLRGTFDYMAPDFMDEAFSGDEQSDIFSLGVVLHEIISGKLPYIDGAGSDVRGWMSRWRQWTNDMERADSPIFVHAMTMRLLNGAYEVLEKALEPNRSRRYAKFAAFRTDLDKITFYEQKHGDRTYRRLQFVGKGGFGEVFKARWIEKNVDVAVKQLLNAEYAKRFQTEARVMQELQDPCFVKFIDFFETLDHAFLVMKFLESMPGSSLRDAINRVGKNGIPKNLVLPAFERYARGLSLMHKKKIIHRDIKPGNLYYPVGRPDLVAIMDFGIVKSEENSVTQGMVPCTLDYAPPEIAVTDSRGGPGMDIFALGLCMYEALTGSQGYPRVASGTAGLVSWFERCKAMQKPIFDDPRVVGDPELLALLRKMTAPDPSKRFQDADEVAIAIRKLFYRKTDEDECPPTVVFGPETDPTRPIDVEGLMSWFKEWGKCHDVEREADLIRWWKDWTKSHPDFPPLPPPRPQRSSGHWKRLTLFGFFVACISVCGVLFFPQIRQRLVPQPTPVLPQPTPVKPEQSPVEPNPSPVVPVTSVVVRPPSPVIPPPPPVPPKPDPAIIELKRQLFEQKFAAALADEPIENRRSRLSDGLKLLAQARKDELYDDEGKWRDFEGKLGAATSALVGKIKNVCGCDLTVDGQVLTVGEVRLFKFEDGKTDGRQMRIFGYDMRPVPGDLDGKTIEVTKSDFEVSILEIALPKLEVGVQCYFSNRLVQSSLLLKPGDYLCEYRRKGYESQKIPFSVKLGEKRSLPRPQTWEPSLVDVSLPKLEKDVVARMDGKKIPAVFKLRPADHYKVDYSRAGYDDQSRSFAVELATPRTLPPPGEWKVSRVKVSMPKRPDVLPKPPVVPPVPKVLPPEVQKLLDDARFYFDSHDYGMTVKCLYDAYGLGYRLNGNDKNLLEAAYQKQRQFLLTQIDNLENVEFRKKYDKRDINKYQKELRELNEWYRAIR